MSLDGLHGSVFIQRASEAAAPLREAFMRLAEATGEVRLDIRGVHPVVRSRISRALQTENPLATLHRLPGPEGLRGVLSAARRSGVDPAIIAECENRVADFERFVTTERISRETLHTMLGGVLPEARKSTFRSASQASFKARSTIVGHCADASILSLFLFPGSDPGHVSAANVRGSKGWRRLRNNAWFAAHGSRHALHSPDQPHTDLRGVPLAELESAPLLEAFCSRPFPVFDAVALPHGRNYYLRGEEVGIRSMCDFFVGEIVHNATPRWRTEDRSVNIESLVVASPSKHLVMDVFVHRDVWPGREPALECYGTVPLGQVNESDYAWRRHDRIDAGLTLQHLEPAQGAIDCSAVRNYPAMLGAVLDAIGHGAGEFRGYRCEQSYPVYGSQIVFRFDLPDRDG